MPSTASTSKASSIIKQTNKNSKFLLSLQAEITFQKLSVWKVTTLSSSLDISTNNIYSFKLNPKSLISYSIEKLVYKYEKQCILVTWIFFMIKPHTQKSTTQNHWFPLQLKAYFICILVRQDLDPSIMTNIGSL